MNGFESIVNQMANRDNSNTGDYLDDDGFLVCGKCNTRKQTEREWIDNEIRKLPIMCQCETQRYQAEQEEQKKRKFQEYVDVLRRDGLTDLKYLKHTFELDDRRYPDISDSCRMYVEQWAEMKEKNVGILFYGDVGVGKTFYGCCIANALLDKQITACVTNFPTILAKLQSGFDNSDYITSLQRYSLLVIDDLGVERDTPTALERTYSIIDARIRSDKPLIVTTNLSPEDINNPANIAYKRIYDRVLENSITVKMTGSSRRRETSREKSKKYGDLLGFNKKGGSS